MRQWIHGLQMLMSMLVVLSLTGCVVIENHGGAGGNGSDGDNQISVNTGPINIHIENNGSFISGSTEVSEVVHKEFNAGKVNSLRVVDQLGSIEIAPADGANTIHIEAKKVVQGSQSIDELKPYLSKIQPTARLEGDVLVVESNIPSQGFPPGAGGLVHYVITVPSRLGVDLHTENSPITVRGVNGGVTARTSNDAVEMNDVGGILNVTTTNSPISLDGANVAERLSLESTNGEITCDSVHATGKTLKVSLSSTNASIHFAGDASELKLDTTNGSIEAEPTDRLIFENGTLDTTNASVTLTVSPSFSALVQADTTNATIRTSGVSDYDDDSQDTSRTIALGKRQAPFHIDTTNGSIQVEVQR